MSYSQLLIKQGWGRLSKWGHRATGKTDREWVMPLSIEQPTCTCCFSWANDCFNTSIQAPKIACRNCCKTYQAGVDPADEPLHVLRDGGSFIFRPNSNEMLPFLDDVIGLALKPRGIFRRSTAEKMKKSLHIGFNYNSWLPRGFMTDILAALYTVTGIKANMFFLQQLLVSCHK